MHGEEIVLLIVLDMAVPTENINFEYFGPLGTHM